MLKIDEIRSEMIKEKSLLNQSINNQIKEFLSKYPKAVILNTELPFSIDITVNLPLLRDQFGLSDEEDKRYISTTTDFSKFTDNFS